MFAAKSRVIALVGSTLFSVVAMGCGGGGAEPDSPPPVAVVTSVVVSIDSTSITIPHTAKATAVAKDNSGNTLTGRTITFSSQSTGIATVDASSGVITGVAAGTTNIIATSEGVTGQASIQVKAAPPVPVATVIVTLDSLTMAPGHVAHATAVTKDANGNVLTGRTVTWTSGTTSVATIDANNGTITSVASGSTVITGTSEGKTGTATLSVQIVDPSAGPADLVSFDFETGTLGPFQNPYGQDLDVVDDPTGSGHGKVARLHYFGTNQDRNRAMMYEIPAGRGLGTSTYFKGDFFLPAGINTSPTFAQRKLLYWQRELSGSFPEFSVIVTMFGTELKVNNVYVPKTGPVVEQQTPVLVTLVPGRWYTIETQVTLNSSFAAKDGIFRLWLDGVMLYENKALTWSDPNWTNPESGQRFRYFEIGDQVNSSQTFDEFRYWDNIKFGTRRISP